MKIGGNYINDIKIGNTSVVKVVKNGVTYLDFSAVSTLTQRSTTYFVGNNKVTTPEPFINGTQWELRFSFTFKAGTNSFLFGNSTDSTNYIYVPSAGSDIRLCVPGSGTVNYGYRFIEGIHYNVFIKRNDLTVTFKILRRNEKDILGYSPTSSGALTTNASSVFNIIGQRSSIYYTDSFLYDVEIYDLADNLQHKYTGTDEDWSDHVGIINGTLTSSNLQQFDYYNTNYSNTNHIYGNDYFIDTESWINTGLTFDGINLISILYKVTPNSVKLQKYDQNTGIEISSLDITGVCPVNSLQGLSFKSDDNTYLVTLNDSNDSNIVKMCNIDQEGNLLSTVVLESAPLNGAGMISYDLSLDNNLGGVWMNFYGGSSSTIINKYKLDGTLIESTVFASAPFSSESLHYDNGYLWISNGSRIRLTESNNPNKIILDIDHPGITIYGGGEDEGMTRIGDWMYLNSDTFTHLTLPNKNVIWKFRAVNIN